MARKSKLTEAQWAEIQTRLIKGEACRALAREFGVGESTIREKVSTQCAEINSVVGQVISADQAFKSLPISAQITAQSLIDELRGISIHLAGAARLGAQTAHRLAGIANQQVQLLDDADPDTGKLRTVAALSSVANEAAKVGLNLLAANKDEMRDANQRGNKPKVPPLSDFYGG